MKDLVKHARVLWNQLLQDPWGPAGSLGEPGPLDGFSVVSDKKTKTKNNEKRKTQFLGVFHVLENKQQIKKHKK